MKICLIFLLTANTFFACFAQTNSPAVIMSSGTYTEGDDASLSWTIGESLIESYGENNFLLLQGFNETDDFEATTGKESFEDAGVFVYPTYTHTIINIDFTWETNETCTGELLDMNGKVLSTVIFKPDHNEISLQEYVFGLYLLRIKIDNSLLTETRVIKY